MFFLRAAMLQVGTLKYSMNEGLTFEFDVQFFDSEELSTATITVYNLNETSRKNIKKNQVVILNAGYEDDIGVIFVGQVSSVSHKQTATDWQSKITATAALDQWLNKQVNKTYSKNTTAKDIVRDLLHIFGLEVGILQLVKNVTYPRGRVCSGKLKNVLTQIVTKECKSRLLIRDNQIVISDPKTGMVKGCLLTPESGLLASTDDLDETMTSIAIVSKDSEEEKASEVKTWKRQCLLNYRIGAGEAVQIKSDSLTGKYIVISGRHKGSPTGTWLTELELKMIGGKE